MFLPHHYRWISNDCTLNDCVCREPVFIDTLRCPSFTCSYIRNSPIVYLCYYNCHLKKLDWMAIVNFYLLVLKFSIILKLSPITISELKYHFQNRFVKDLISPFNWPNRNWNYFCIIKINNRLIIVLVYVSKVINIS